MKKGLWITIGLVLAIILSGTLGYALSQDGDSDGFTPVTEEESQRLAEDYLVSSPTFVFDGIEDTLRLVETNALPFLLGI